MILNGGKHGVSVVANRQAFIQPMNVKWDVAWVDELSAGNIAAVRPFLFDLS